MAIPKKAKRVFKGVIFDVYHWPQKIFDGSTRTFERATRKDSVSVLATVGNKILLSHQRQPTTGLYIDFFGGRVDEGENAKQTAVRELTEETGLKPRRMILHKVFPTEGHLEFKTYLYIAKDCIKVGEQELDGGEKIKIKSYTFDQFLKLVYLPDSYFRGAVKLYLSRALWDKKFKARLKKEIFS